ncbi:M48 family metallopeptidase [Kitasatospora sp. NBC_01246]|uniref:M48 family metallopeptidase n=1 Tax=Kitasatospora sp. NBC_01246 TaxID=2903570 RepID=UPI002E338FB5|nr:M48 family metallopeptidase [Kitasatospora sp. NBC_01246]
MSTPVRPTPTGAAPTATAPDAPAATGAAPQDCPRCAAPVDADPRFAVWCPQCEWNLSPEPADAPAATRRAVAAARHAAAATARTDRLYEDIAAGRPAAVGQRAWLAASVIAGVVHLTTAALCGWGLWLLVTGNTPLRCLGAAVLAVAVLLRPRLGRTPRGEGVLDRAEAPALYGLADRVAAEVGAGPVGVIRVDCAFNASMGAVGLRRRSVLTLGLPLWEVLGEQERIALLGHEFGHRVNGDHRQGLWLGSAIHALAHWYDLTRPRGHYRDAVGLQLLFQLTDLLLVVLLGGVARLLLALLRLLDRLTSRAGQQAEYHADTLAARTASTGAARRLLRTLLLGQAVETAAARARAELQSRPRASRRGPQHAPAAPSTRTAATPEAFWERLRDQAADVPALEHERLLRRSALERGAVDPTHPPTHLRLALLDRGPELPAAVTTTPAETAAIAAELAPHRVRIARTLLAG